MNWKYETHELYPYPSNLSGETGNPHLSSNCLLVILFTGQDDLSYSSFSRSQPDSFIPPPISVSGVKFRIRENWTQLLRYHFPYALITLLQDYYHDYSAVLVIDIEVYYKISHALFSVSYHACAHLNGYVQIKIKAFHVRIKSSHGKYQK
ncbi:hypothetical protein BDC45DRAFT_534873 [Circinella umbellata]|nr:hypothetical protein BDC45DRAFT_534873 [Circinella umbellata]